MNPYIISLTVALIVAFYIVIVKPIARIVRMHNRDRQVENLKTHYNVSKVNGTMNEKELKKLDWDICALRDKAL